MSRWWTWNDMVPNPYIPEYQIPPGVYMPMEFHSGRLLVAYASEGLMRVSLNDSEVKLLF